MTALFTFLSAAHAAWPGQVSAGVRANGGSATDHARSGVVSHRAAGGAAGGVGGGVGGGAAGGVGGVGGVGDLF